MTISKYGNQVNVIDWNLVVYLHQYHSSGHLYGGSSIEYQEEKLIHTIWIQKCGHLEEAFQEDHKEV